MEWESFGYWKIVKKELFFTSWTVRSWPLDRFYQISTVGPYLWSYGWRKILILFFSLFLFLFPFLFLSFFFFNSFLPCAVSSNPPSISFFLSLRLENSFFPCSLPRFVTIEWLVRIYPLKVHLITCIKLFREFIIVFKVCFYICRLN